jgi:pimeloyl-ACP methyl ester carboxylesterase
MEKIRSKDGTLIAYRQSGEGPPLLLVHGTGGTSRRWAPVVPLLERDFAVYAMDRRGRGESDDAAGPYAIEREFEDVAAVVDGIGGKVHLFGHSYGGICALESALLTGRIDRLVLYEPPMKADSTRVLDPAFLGRLQALLAAGDREGALMAFMREVVRMPEHEIRLSTSLPAWPDRVAAAHTLPRELIAHEGYRFDASRFKGMTLPTLLLVGGDSPDHVRAAIRLLSDVLCNSRVTVLPGQQHVAMETAPEMLAKAVTDFLLQGQPHKDTGVK